MKPRLNRPAEQPGAEFFQTMRERYLLGLRVDRTDRAAAEEDVRFASGGRNQWDPAVVRARKKRPVLTENRLGPSIAQIVNDGRQNKPSIVCTPMDQGTEETSEYYQGRIRQIEYECDADVAYDTARKAQVTCGRGFYRVVMRQRGDDDQDQYPDIVPIENQFSVVWDPSARRYDLADADWTFVLQVISKDRHEREFGTDTLASANGFFLEGDNPAPGWMGLGSDGDMVRVADYYYRDYDDVTEDGSPKVKICATNGVEVLDETEWIAPENGIPVLPQWGERMIVDDEIQTGSLVRDAKDPQRLVNLYVSNIAEEISRMPKQPYMAAEGQIAGREDEWETINEVQRAVVQYKPKASDGTVVGPPQRQAAEPPIQALVTGYLQAIDAIKAAMGIFDASLGAGPGDTAGVAIAQRRTESDIANFHYSDNEARTRKRLGRILLEIIPKIDGTEPAEKPVRDAAGKVRLVRINEPFVDKKTGKTLHHKLDVGRYQIAVSTGPSYTSQREQENERVGEVLKASPELIWVMGDIYFETSDGPGAAQMAERMKRAISMKSPGLVDNDQTDPRQALQAAMHAAQGLQQQNQMLVAETHRLAQIIETKQVETQGRFQQAALDSWTKLKVAEINNLLRQGIADADRVAATEERMFGAAHDVGMEAMQHAHAVIQGQQAQDQNLEMQAQQTLPLDQGAPATQPVQQ